LPFSKKLRRQSLVNRQETNQVSGTPVMFASLVHRFSGLSFCCLVPHHLLTALFQGEQVTLWVLAKASLLPPCLLADIERFP